MLFFPLLALSNTYYRFSRLSSLALLPKVSTVLQAALKKANIKPEDVSDICLGNVLKADDAIVGRIGQFIAGIPPSTPLSTVNRQCSSGLQACMHVANAIKAGQYDIGIGGGFESMTQNSMGGTVPDLTWDAVGDSVLAQSCMIPMGITSENVAEKFGVSRTKQDEMAIISHNRAAAAQAAGKFDDEIVPIKTKLDDEEVTISKGRSLVLMRVVTFLTVFDFCHL